MAQHIYHSLTLPKLREAIAVLGTSALSWRALDHGLGRIGEFREKFAIRCTRLDIGVPVGKHW